VSFLGDSLALVALMLHVASTTGRALAVALLLLVLVGLGAVRAVAIGYFAVVACTGIDDVALLFLATGTFGAGAAAVGLLLGAVGIGLLAGYALLSRTRQPVPMTVLLLAGFAVSSAGNLFTGLAWAVAAAFAPQAVRGLGIAAMDIAATTLTQRIVPRTCSAGCSAASTAGSGSPPRSPTSSAACCSTAPPPGVAFVAAGTAGLLATASTALDLRRGAG
jgi:hypothetical protein